jgi:hypothetical protein
VSLFVGHGFSRKRGNKPYFKLYIKKEALFFYRVMPKKLGFGA